MDATTLPAPLYAAGLLLFLAAACQDLAFRLVSNRLPALIAATGLWLHMLHGDASAASAVAALVVLAAALCWRRGWLGGADVKLFGAGALLLPLGAVCPFLLATSLAGGLLAVVYSMAGRWAGAAPGGGRPLGYVRRLVRVERWRLRRGGPLPYAVALSVGACIALVRG